ncbi:hypothetical protein HaLaN_16865 [Haematococcus lacustris]|uniref:Uncharacterized protein n=1 Tax=Haematococcus lacustris TaxID=44745 RepID=A0A699ZLZ7_HAELA|nr:hypothetical protein HaLaN_16865 [Haematococcus lacustris]
MGMARDGRRWDGAAGRMARPDLVMVNSLNTTLTQPPGPARLSFCPALVVMDGEAANGWDADESESVLFRKCQGPWRGAARDRSQRTRSVATWPLAEVESCPAPGPRPRLFKPPKTTRDTIIYYLRALDGQAVNHHARSDCRHFTLVLDGDWFTSQWRHPPAPACTAPHQHTPSLIPTPRTRH